MLALRSTRASFLTHHINGKSNGDVVETANAGLKDAECNGEELCRDSGRLLSDLRESIQMR